MILDADDKFWLKKLVELAVIAIVYALKNEEAAETARKHFLDTYKRVWFR